MNGKILIIGGAGYIGTVLSNYLMKKNYKVICLDNFLYENFFSLNNIKQNKNFELINGDLRNTEKLNKIIEEVDSVVILGGLVGDPITKKYPKLSTEINDNGTVDLINICEKKKLEKTIFVSTCSNYGLSESDKLLNESDELKPISLYAKQKVKIEKHILSFKDSFNFHPTILRFATAFGLSPRMRYDLTINQFTKSIFFNENLEVFDAQTWRPYCHVEDFALAIEKIIESEKKITSYEVFNVGNDKNNFTKKKIVEKILDYSPGSKVTFTDKKSDPRNYRVDFSKIKECLNFETKYSVNTGIEEIIDYLKKNNLNIENFDNQKFGNYSINSEK